MKLLEKIIIILEEDERFFSNKIFCFHFPFHSYETTLVEVTSHACFLNNVILLTPNGENRLTVVTQLATFELSRQNAQVHSNVKS